MLLMWVTFVLCLVCLIGVSGESTGGIVSFGRLTANMGWMSAAFTLGLMPYSMFRREVDEGTLESLELAVGAKRTILGVFGGIAAGAGLIVLPTAVLSVVAVVWGNATWWGTSLFAAYWLAAGASLGGAGAYAAMRGRGFLGPLVLWMVSLVLVPLMIFGPMLVWPLIYEDRLPPRRAKA